MRIAVTGATGFLGSYIVSRALEMGHRVRCWYRDAARRAEPSWDEDSVDWVEGSLGQAEDAGRLVEGCDAVVHAAFARQGRGFRGAEGDVLEFAQANLIGTLQLIEAARAANVARMVFVSSGAVHERICADRPLDEQHVLWPQTHYGAHKAALEKFVHSYGWGEGFDICAVRPTAIYGLASPPEQSRWWDLVAQVVRGQPVECTRGTKAVHAADVARAIHLLLSTTDTAGECYEVCERYFSDFEVAIVARRLSGSDAEITGQAGQPKHNIDTSKLRSLGMEFGGDELFRSTIAQLVAAAS